MTGVGIVIHGIDAIDSRPRLLWASG